MKQLFKNIWWQIKSHTVGKKWEKIELNIDKKTKEFIFNRSIQTGECIEQIIHALLNEYLKQEKMK